jgi:hypothetical protein
LKDINLSVFKRILISKFKKISNRPHLHFNLISFNRCLTTQSGVTCTAGSKGVEMPSSSSPGSSGHQRSRSRRSQKSSHRNMDSSMRQHSQQQLVPTNDFDMSKIQDSICAIASDQAEAVLQNPSHARPLYTTPPSGSNGAKDSIDSKVKKERIKILWGKAKKQGLLQAAAAKKLPESTHGTWEQNQICDLSLITVAPVATGYFHTTVGGEASGGSGFYGQPGNSTMECDCGDDSCSKCNLMLNMGSSY